MGSVDDVWLNVFVRGFLNRLARENGKTAFVGLLFDGKEFVLDKEDLLEIANILKTVFEGMDDTEGVIFPLGNREIFMNWG